MTEKSIPFLETAQTKYRRYATHILGFRHFSEYRDGLKPVQRRALWSAYELGATSKAKMTKGASVVGRTFGHYHPHSEGAIYGALARLTQASMATPLVIGVGNWGRRGSKPAASRYTSCYLSPYALTMLEPSEIAVVPRDLTYDGKHEEPRYLPVCVPHLLLAGVNSLAAGYNGNIPPMPLNWVLDALGNTLAGKKLRQPTAMAYRDGGELLKLDSEWIDTGVGRGVFRPTMRLEGSDLILTSLAPKLSLDDIEATLSNHPGFGGMTTESAQGDDPIRLVVRAKRGTPVLDLGKYARKNLVTSVKYSFLDIAMRLDEQGDVTYDPVIEGPTAFLIHWLQWRKKLITAAAKYRAVAHRKEARRQELLMLAVNLRKELDKIRDSAKSTADIRTRTMKLLKCTDEEAGVVMGISWPRLATLETPALKAKRDEELKEAKREDGIAAAPQKYVMPMAEATTEALKKTLIEAASMRKFADTKRRSK